MTRRLMIRAAVTAGALALLGGPALAVAGDPLYPGPNPPNNPVCVGAACETEVRGTLQERAPGGGIATRGAGSSLPVTGGDLVGLAGIGLGAIAAGTLLVRRGRAASA